MSNPVSLSTLRTKIRQLANMENSQFVTDNELDDFIEEEAKAFWDYVLKHQKQEWFVKSSTITTVSGTSVYNLPSDFYQLLQVLYQSSSDSWCRAEQFEFANLDLLKTVSNFDNQNDQLYYRLQHDINAQGSAFVDQINVQPSPKSVFTIEIYYIPVMQNLTYEGVTLYEDVNGWFSSWARLAGAMYCLKKEESSVDHILMLWNQLKDRIKNHAGQRDKGRAPTMVDVKRDSGPTTDSHYVRGRWR